MSTKKIANSELEVMRILWREERPLTFTEIRQELENKMGWNKSTIYTLVLRLRKKGIISTRPGTVMLHSPTISKQEYLQMEEQSFLDKVFDGGTKNLLATLYQNRKLDDKTLAELKAYFEMEEDQK
ncbi:MAG: BlaI/MecI/CopY family transcriptional regulator [Peptococcaceae bacterium]|nr:BlaI/MecI/CopY family transcriptional regulator [Peptococcaceae bacterium]